MGALSDRFLPYVEDIAVHLLGEPASRSRSELRWGGKGSFRVTIAGPHRGRFRDFETENKGDLVDLVRLKTGRDLPGTIAWLEDFVGDMPPAPLTQGRSAPAHVPQMWSRKAQTIWDHTIPLGGTLGEAYLHSRHCYVPHAFDLRFSNGGGKYPPSLVARVTDFESGEPMTLTFIQLDPQTGMKASGQAKRFLADHRMDGGVVRLSRIVEVGGRLGLAEGVETALTVIAEGRGPVWATLGAGNMMKLAPSSKYGDLIIWADNGQVGEKAARHLSENWMAADHVVRIARPAPPFGDWNDVVMADAREGCK